MVSAVLLLTVSGETPAEVSFLLLCTQHVILFRHLLLTCGERFDFHMPRCSLLYVPCAWIHRAYQIFGLRVLIKIGNILSIISSTIYFLFLCHFFRERPTVAEMSQKSDRGRNQAALGGSESSGLLRGGSQRSSALKTRAPSSDATLLT